jgi:large subunit ribosomal protein L9
VIELILRKTIDNLGRRGETVKVANGYARNYLLPQQLALLVTESSRRQIEHERKAANALESEKRQAAEALASCVGGLECVIAKRVGETEALYGSVTSADIAGFLTSQSLAIDKRQIQLPEPLKQLGEYMVPLKLHPEVTAELKVRVVRDETHDVGSDAALSS